MKKLVRSSSCWGYLWGNFGGLWIISQMGACLDAAGVVRRGDLDTMSLDDLYNHLKVYESEVQKKSEPNSQNMAFISLAKHSSRNEDGNTACAYIASQSSGSQIKFEDINQIDEDDIEEMDIKWNMALLSIRADKFWKKTRKKISIQGSDVTGFDKSKVECFNCHKMGHFTRECRAPRSQERGRRDNYRQGSKAEEQAPKALMAIDGVFDNSLCSKDCKKNNDSLNNKITDLTDKLFDAKNLIYYYKLALAQVESRLVVYKEREVKYCEKIRTLEFMNESNNECIEILKKKLKTLKEEKEGVDGKLAGLLTASKDLDNLIESQRLDKNKGRLRYSTVPPPPAKLYLSPKKDLSWTGLPECAGDTVTDYSRPSPTIESTSRDDQNRNPSVSETVASPITTKPFIKFVKSKDSQSKSKTGKTESPKKPPVKSFQRTSALRSHYRAPWVLTVNKSFPPVNRKFSTGSRNFPTANRKFPTGSRKFSTGSTKCSIADMGMKGKAVKPSACWFWKPLQNLSNKGPTDNSVSVMFKKYTYIDTQGRLNGCSRHMTGNISYLFDYEPFDGGYVSFGQGGCKITGKGTIKTGKLAFENVYFVKDLKYNLFSVSQICDNKNSVLFTDSECIVLGRDFKLLDDANILLRTPRQHNMHNLVRGLPTKCFENDHTCTACLKGKQHKASCVTMGGEFRNKEMNEFCSRKGIKREFSKARTPQQNGVAERRNRTLIEAARIMLAD
nr:hypothetical protein [Tanacetum cinerariifolium]